jgi:predicted transcriptional regulator
MSMSNAERFLNAFNAIEKHLRLHRQGGGHDGFRNLVRQAAVKNSAVRRYQRDLEQLAELRNAVVHNGYADGRPIADPREDTVELIEHIAATIQDPPRVYPLFKANVATVSADDPITSAIQLMHRAGFAQIPVLQDGSFHALLTANIVVRWLGAQAEAGMADLDTPVREILRYSGRRENFTFVPVTETVFELVETFEAFERRGERLDAVLITRSGKPAERIVGIATVADLPRAVRAMSK